MDKDALCFTDGLIPAIIQDATTKEVLMMAWMNSDALDKTLETGQTHFWSRSRNQLWHKGETSGHIQKVKAMTLDCDSDTLLVEVEQVGAACHTGRRSCFFNAMTDPYKPPDGASLTPLRPLDVLCETIAARKQHPSDASYTSRLLLGNIDGLLKKVAEEAIEFILSIKNGRTEAIIHEAADLVYHFLVALGRQGISLAEVEEVLRARSFQSGLTEKQGRSTGSL